MEESQDFKPDRGNPAVRHYRGASENVTLVEMCSHLATERAGMGTLHLTIGASEFYPNRFSELDHCSGAPALVPWSDFSWRALSANAKTREVYSPFIRFLFALSARTLPVT